VLLRIANILQLRVAALSGAFKNAIDEWPTQGRSQNFDLVLSLEQRSMAVTGALAS